MIYLSKRSLIIIISTLLLATILIFCWIFWDFFSEQQSESTSSTIPALPPSTSNKQSTKQSLPSFQSPGKPNPQQVLLLQKIPSLQTIDERQQYYDDLLKKPVDLVWSIWLQATINDYGGTQQRIADRALTKLLRKEENKFIYSEIEKTLGQTSLKLGERASIVGLLGEASTNEALTIVLNALEREPYSDLRPALVAGIGDFNCEQMDGFRTSCAEMSIPLEAAWATTPVEGYKDKELLRALTGTIAKVGAPSGVNILLETISESNKPLSSLSIENDPRAYYALQSISEIDNSESLSILEQWRDRVNDPKFKALITEVIEGVRDINNLPPER